MVSIVMRQGRAALGVRAERPSPRITTPRRAVLAKLAERVQRLCAHSPRPLPRCPSGFAALDAALGGGLARGAVHEFLALGGSAAACSVALLTATRAAERQRWILYIDATGDFYPPAAAQLGVPLERLVVVRAAGRMEALWTAEQGLRCTGVAAVVSPLWSIDARVSRRLQLAVETGGGLGLFICREGERATFAASRLRFEPLPAKRGRRLLVSVLKLREASLPEPVVVELPDGLSPTGGGSAFRARAVRVWSAAQSMELPVRRSG